MVGSILGTFLTGFFLIDIIGTKGVLLLLGTTMAFGATMLGSVWHAIWAGIPLGLCVLAFTRRLAGSRQIGLALAPDGKVREDRPPVGHPRAAGRPRRGTPSIAWVDESNYYYIKVENEIEIE